MNIVARKKKLIIFWLFWLGLFSLIWKNMLVFEPDGLFAGWVNIWGDWAAHLSYATSFGYGSNISLELPILAGVKFSYPFLSDWFSGMLMKSGFSLLFSMLIPSFCFSILLVFMLFKFGEKISGDLKGGIITSFLFLFNGGLGFWWFFTDISNLGFIETMKALPREYTHLGKLANIEWINIITSQVIPQRGFLMGFPIVVVIYLLLWQKFENNNKTKMMMAIGLLTSLLPLIHAHSFILVGWVAFWLMIMEIIKKRGFKIQLIKEWGKFWFPVIFIGISQVLFFYKGPLSKKGFIRFQPGWMAEGNILWFWIKNLGMSLGLALIGLQSASKKLVKFSLPFWALFLIANLWIFQPWEWDNTKILTHWYLMISVLGSLTIIKLLSHKKKIFKILAMVGFIISIWSGFLDTIRLTQYKNVKIRFFNNQELKLVEWVKSNTKKESRFLTADNHDHWLPVLTGRKILLGFKGWLWTYGIDYSYQEKAVNQMFKGDQETKNLLKKWGVNYVVIGPKERIKKINEKFYESNFKKVYELGDTKIFEISNFEFTDFDK